MTRRRWIADEAWDNRAALTGAHAAHLSRTLRARVGQEFEVVCGSRVRRAIVAIVTDQRVEFTLAEEIAAAAAAPPKRPLGPVPESAACAQNEGLAVKPIPWAKATRALYK